jgi:hypothetical protein
MFQRKFQDCFAIDSPVKTTTMLMSGLAMLKVITALGYSLVCLDTRGGIVFNVITHKRSDDTSYLACPDISKPRLRSAKEHRGAQRLRLQLTSPRHWSWRESKGFSMFWMPNLYNFKEWNVGLKTRLIFHSRYFQSFPISLNTMPFTCASKPSSPPSPPWSP